MRVRLDYDPKTGRELPVCEGFELSATQDPRPITSIPAATCHCADAVRESLG